MNKFAHRWPAGARVSAARGQITGTVVVNRRKADGKPYRQVRVHATPRRWEWPDDWVLGVGPVEHTCWDCGQVFRDDHPAGNRDECPICGEADASFYAGIDDADQIRKPRAFLHGTPTPLRTRPVDAATEARQQAHAADIKDWSPF